MTVHRVRVPAQIVDGTVSSGVPSDARELVVDEQVEVKSASAERGRAGISVARELIGSGARVWLLDSGGKDMERRRAALNRRRSVGYPIHVPHQSRVGGVRRDDPAHRVLPRSTETSRRTTTATTTTPDRRVESVEQWVANDRPEARPLHQVLPGGRPRQPRGADARAAGAPCAHFLLGARFAISRAIVVSGAQIRRALRQRRSTGASKVRARSEADGQA